METKPEIQLIANIVVRNPEGKVLLIKYGDEDERWWLPGDDLETYQHPDERAKQLLGQLEGVQVSEPELVFIESFRGRRGWHVMFNYRCSGSGETRSVHKAEWFDPTDLPPTMHGRWERGVIERVLQNV